MKRINDEDILRLYNQGLLHREIADQLGCATCTVTNHLLKIGIRSYDMGRRQQVLNLHNKGLYDKDIAETLGVTREDVTHLLNVQGITNRHIKADDLDLRSRISNSLTGRFVGENNPNYKGYTNEKRVARGIFKTISKRVMRKEDYICEVCGKRGGDLEVHHIKPFIVIMNEFFENVYDGNINNIYEQLIKYPDFMDESNLVVLCHDCHWRVHYSDDHELSPYRWESATTIERIS